MKTTSEIINGDCVKELRKLQAESVDLTITSPPYDNLRTYHGFSFDFKKTARQLLRVTKPGGVVVWVVGDQTEDGTESGTSFAQALFFKKIGFNLHDTMIFEKHNFSNPSHNRYHQLFEYMFIFSKGKPKTFHPIKDKKNRYAGISAYGRNTSRQADGSFVERERNIIQEFGMRGNIWRYLVGTASKDDAIAFEHPAIFPEALAEDHVLSWSNPGELVIDPFCGSGTTGKAALKHCRSFIGIDTSLVFCDLAKVRTSQTTLI